jgi:hypothetical protein
MGAAEHLRPHRFQPGNTYGRLPKVQRKQRLPDRVLDDVLTVWEEEGIGALRECARSKPDVFVRLAASLVPKELVLSSNKEEGGSFLAALAAVQAQARGETPELAHVIDVTPEAETVQACEPAQDAQPKRKRRGKLPGLRLPDPGSSE